MTTREGVAGDPHPLAAARRLLQPPWIDLLATATVFVTLAWWSWRRWPDLLVDFGQQLYVPWRLSQGARLHDGIDFLHGPLSQHLNALGFSLFGTSFTVLIFMNLVILAVLTWSLRSLAGSGTDRITATGVGLCFLCLFGFSQYVVTGNYNYVAPYTHEATHGMALAIGMLLALTRAVLGGRRWLWAVAGLCLGLTLLTKVDVAMAAGLAAAAGILLARWRRRAGPGRLLLFGLFAAAPVIGFALYFLSYLSPGGAWRAVWAGFLSLSGEVASNPFYRHVAGWDDPGGNLRRMLGGFLWIVALGTVGWFIDAAVCRRARHVRAVSAGAGLVLFAALVLLPGLFPWREIPRGLPLATLLALVVLGHQLWRGRDDGRGWSALVPSVLLAVFALALLPKIVLNVHLHHYGFYLAMPATLLLVLCTVWWIPQWRAARDGGGTAFRALGLAVLAAGMVVHVGRSAAFYGAKTFPVGRGGDTIFTYDPDLQPAGPIVAKAVEWIVRETRPDDTLVGFPEGIMLNYLSRRAAPAPAMNYMMTEMILFGEDRLLADLMARPPDYVALVHKDTSEFGVRFFGTDPRYGQRILLWVSEHYEPAALFGAEPLRDQRFGIGILRRRED